MKSDGSSIDKIKTKRRLTCCLMNDDRNKINAFGGLGICDLSFLRPWDGFFAWISGSVVPHSAGGKSRSDSGLCGSTSSLNVSSVMFGAKEIS
jgi:hypothetical protein